MSAWQRGQGRRAGWLFLLPALVLLVLFVVWPLLRAFWWSLNATDLLTPDRQHWLGGAQYSALLRDERFRRAFAIPGT